MNRKHKSGVQYLAQHPGWKTRKRRPTPKIVIVIKGGLIQNVLSTVPVEVLRIDYDIEGADPDNLTYISQSDGQTPRYATTFAPAYANFWTATRKSGEVCPKRVNAL